MRPSLSAAESILERVWGFPGFRTAQRRVVLAALCGRDCLAMLPTGGGKSLCYQVPALALPGLTVVVSPLISLMQDQVAALQRRGVAAEYLSSTQAGDVRRNVLEALRAGRLKLLYVAPERLAQMVPIVAGRVSLLAVDEAHCISEWGHDFRPHYRAIGGFHRAVGSPPMLALTATATPATRADILGVLGLRSPVRVATSFDRPNLHFRVQPFAAEGPRLARLAERLRRLEESAVIYQPTRNRTDGIAGILSRWGFPAAPYHAGLPGAERTRLLDRFMSGDARIIVATNAFGMGIDKPDVRLVVHLGIPARPESYWQEAGRAGRDGRPARCELMWVPGDLRLARQMAMSRKQAPAAAAGFAAMERYLTTTGCRRRVLLEYLGETPIACGGCDNC